MKSMFQAIPEGNETGLSADAKKRYQKPELKQYGSVGELTGSGTTSGSENSSGGRKGSCVGVNAAFRTCV